MSTIQDMVFRIKADAQSFQKEMRQVEKTTKAASKTALDETKKQADAQKLSLQQIREKAREEARLGREAAAIFDRTRTAAEKYEEQVADLSAHLKAGRIDQETFNRAMEGLKKPTDNAAQSLSATSQVTGHFKGQIAALVSPVGLATAAIGALVAGLKYSHDAFKEHEKSLRDLNLTYSNLGIATDGVQEKLTRNAHAWGVSLTEQQGAISALVKASGDAVQSEQDLQRAFRISATTGVSLADATRALIDARSGNIATLYDLNLLTAQEAKNLEAVENQGVKVADAFKKIDDRIEEVTPKVTAFSAGMNEMKATQEQVAIATGKAANSLWELGKAYVMLGGIGAGIAYFRGVKQAKEEAAAATDKLIEKEKEYLHIEYGPLAQMSQQEADAYVTAAYRKEQADKKLAEQRARQRAAEKAALEQRIELAVYDVEILREQDELEREKLRLKKELYQLQNTIKDAAELEVRSALAKESSAQRQLDIQRKTWNEAEKAWDARKKLEGPSAEQFALQKQVLASLQTPLDAYAKSLEDLDGIYRRGLLTAGQYEQAVLNLNDELAKSEPTTAKAAVAFDGLAQIGETAANSLMVSFKTSLFDPMNASFEDMAKNFVRAIGEMALQVLMLQGLKAAAGVTGGADGLLGNFLKRSTGGPVRGPGTSTSDSIPALLSDGEYVHRAKAVSYYGQQFMDDLNNLRIPKHRRYRDGGIVTAAGNAPTGGVQAAQNSSSTAITIINPRTEQEIVAAMQSAAGKKVILNTYLENRKTLLI